MVDEANRLVVIFKEMPVKNEAESKAKGRPIYDSVEAVEVITAGDRNSVKVFPAHSSSGWVTTQDGTQEELTYAMRWSDQYRRFKEGKQQVQDGTPLEELPFLTQAKRLELKALKIYTAETLASLDGQNLKTLGMGGRELKNQAQAYIDNASGSAAVTKLASENEGLKEQLAALRQEVSAIRTATRPEASVSPFDTWEDADIKDFIKSETGVAPRGNPSHATLVGMADEIEQSKVAA